MEMVKKNRTSFPFIEGCSAIIPLSITFQNSLFSFPPRLFSPACCAGTSTRDRSWGGEEPPAQPAASLANPAHLTRPPIPKRLPGLAAYL